MASEDAIVRELMSRGFTMTEAEDAVSRRTLDQKSNDQYEDVGDVVDRIEDEER